MTSAEIKFIKRMAKYTRQDCKTNEDILSELKINLKKIKNYRNECVQHVRRMYRDRRTDRLANLITKYQPCEIRSQGLPLKRLLDR
jgi:thiaminase